MNRTNRRIGKSHRVITWAITHLTRAIEHSHILWANKLTDADASGLAHMTLHCLTASECGSLNYL